MENGRFILSRQQAVLVNEHSAQDRSSVAKKMVGMFPRAPCDGKCICSF